MPKYLYRNYVETLSKRFQSNLNEIEVEHNFDFGPEFEIAICKTLRSALPDKYGIARGYVVNAEGESAGDDIVIFEQSRFPTLDLRGTGSYENKEFIPIEAAYAYIEAKHSLHLEGEGGQSLKRAVDQVEKVKQLCSERSDVTPGMIGPYTRLKGAEASVTMGYPKIANPMYGMILARHVKHTYRDRNLDDPQVINSIQISYPSPDASPPDLIVLGENNVVLPVSHDEVTGGYRLYSPFFLPGQSTGVSRQVEGIAAGVALCSLMQALDYITLGVMPWHHIIGNGLSVPITRSGADEEEG
jgi:hypothetical protein